MNVSYKKNWMKEICILTFPSKKRCSNDVFFWQWNNSKDFSVAFFSLLHFYKLQFRKFCIKYKFSLITWTYTYVSKKIRTLATIIFLPIFLYFVRHACNKTPFKRFNRKRPSESKISCEVQYTLSICVTKKGVCCRVDL